MKAIDVIRKGWCKTDFAQDEHGNSCSTDSKHAVRFCALGAVMRAYGYDYGQYMEPMNKLSAVIRSETGSRDIVSWNYSPKTTHEEVIRVFELADV